MKVLSSLRNRYYERTDPKERFFKYVCKTESCWLWTGGKDKKWGYGKFSSTHKPGWEKAHRFSYRIHKGEIPVGAVICHRCNVKLCVNPDHLYAASQGVNVEQAMNDGLCPKGEKHGMAKLTESSVKEIRGLYEGKQFSMDELATRYGVTKTQISRIIHRETWKHI